ncbi:hypothetical protein HUZ36_07985 [Pseudoalteromonas sp. McH1-7]|uniref:hypothetical protein n=1 Tax=Pseudoalteromonas sp. McH1-7 TaxID=2745574 RepID=UPI001591EB91|nr:hypothetical protein [Pseudoalteromonas sp. McH1-7]NUZ10715.1 hypothetical protein [Pseudoalteromonas sp. McH1-7]
MMSSNQKKMTKITKTKVLSKSENEQVFGGSLGVIKDDPRGSAAPSSGVNLLPISLRKFK